MGSSCLLAGVQSGWHSFYSPFTGYKYLIAILVCAVAVVGFICFHSDIPWAFLGTTGTGMFYVCSISWHCRLLHSMNVFSHLHNYMFYPFFGVWSLYGSHVPHESQNMKVDLGKRLMLVTYTGTKPLCCTLLCFDSCSHSWDMLKVCKYAHCNFDKSWLGYTSVAASIYFASYLYHNQNNL